MSTPAEAPQPLVTLADAKALGITIDDDEQAQRLLNHINASVIEIIGNPVLRSQSTFTLIAPREERFTPPLQPIISVQEVLLDDQPATGWFFVQGELIKPGGWSSTALQTITITATHGYESTPATITTTVLSLLGGGLAALAEGNFGTDSRVRNERIDDYGVGYATGDDAVASPIEVPQRTRAMLRELFGASGATVMEMTQ